MTTHPVSGKTILASHFDRAADLIGLQEHMRRILMRPFRSLEVEVPVRTMQLHNLVTRASPARILVVEDEHLIAREITLS
jgi:hypothetical protein